MKFAIILFLLIILISPVFSQTSNSPSPIRPKIKHASPVFEDLTTELGARKGENELNVNFGYSSLKNNHHILLSQIEYEFAPVDYLGFEIVLPYSIYVNNNLDMVPRPDNEMEFIQWASQLTFYVNESSGISMALGFKNIFDIRSPEIDQEGGRVENIQYYPLLVFAKNRRDKYFFLLSGGPELSQELQPREWDLSFNLNSNFHYAFSEKNHFVGLELNKRIENGSFEMFVRPQIILNVGEDFIVGASFGVPVGLEEEKWTGFLRLAYEF